MADRKTLNDLSTIAQAVTSPEAAASLNLARERGNDIATQNVLLQDQQNLSPLDFLNKYGVEATQAVQRLDVAADNLDVLQSNNSRTLGETFGDFGSGIAVGLNNSLGGIATLGARILGPQAAQTVGQTVKNNADYLQSGESDAMRTSRRLSQMGASLDAQDNKSKYDEDVKTDGKFIAELRSFGRDAAASVGRFVENPLTFQDGVAQGVGSILAAAPSAGLVNTFGAVGRNILSRGAAQASGQVAGQVTTRSAVPVAVGLMEGGSAYAGTSNEILGMTHEALLQSSPMYRSLIEAGHSPDSAKAMVADSAALRSASIQGPLAAATGNLVAGFEAAPLALNSFRTAAGNVLREGVEEGTQGLTGGVAQNYGMQLADENTRLGENLGSAVAEGTILGMASAGGLQAGPTALRTPAKAVGFLAEKGKAVSERIRNTGKPTVEGVSTQLTETVAALPEITESLKAEAIQSAETPERQNAVSTFLDRVAATPTVSASELNSLSPRLLEQVATLAPAEGLPDRFTTVVSLAQGIRDGSLQGNDRVEAGLFIRQQVEDLQDLFENVPDELLNVDQSDPRFAQLDQYAQNLSKIATIPEIATAIVEAGKTKLNTDIDLDGSPEAVQAVRTVAAQATRDPASVDPRLADKILLQSDKGGVSLTPEEKQRIRAASSLVKAGEQYSNTVQDKGIKVPESQMDIVSTHIQEGGGQRHQLSLGDHVARINKAINSNDRDGAMSAITALHMFAQGMANKVNALNESIAAGNGAKIKYVSAGLDNAWLPEDKQYQVAVHPSNSASVNFARRVEAEAEAVITLANNMAEIYPDFGKAQIALPKLNLQPQKATQEAKPTPDKSEAQPKVEARVEPSTKVLEDELVEREGKAERRKQERVIADELVEQEGKKARREAERKAAEPTKQEEPTQQEQEADIEVTDSEEATPSQTIETVFPNLFSKTTELGKNVLHRAYSLPKKAKSRMLEMVSPVAEVASLIGNPDDIKEVVGKELPYALNEDQVAATEKLLSFAPKIRKRLNARFGSQNAQKLLKKIRDDNSNPHLFAEGLVLNLLEIKDNKFSYNRQLIESAILAGLTYAVNAEARTSRMDAKDVAEVLGVPVASVDQTLVDDFNTGMSAQSFQAGLADTIMQYWGFNKNPDAPLNLVEGLPQAVAGELMHALHEVGLVNTLDFKIETTKGTGADKSAFTQRRVIFNSEEVAKNREFLKGIGSGTRLIDDIILTNGNKSAGYFIGEPSNNRPLTQLRSKTKNTKDQTKALIAESKTPYYLNKPMFDFMSAFGMENFIRFMGGQDYKPGTLHPAHERSLEGKNRTLFASYEAMFRFQSELQSHAVDKDITEVPVFFDHEMSVVGRMQMQGLNNPQSDKLIREILMPTRSVLDMTKPEGQELFWMTVAQGLDLKPEKVSRATSVAKAKQVIADTYSDILDDMVAWLDSGKPLPNGLADRIIDAMGNSATMHGLHGLVSVARLMKAEQEGADLTKFETFNYLEADGKTNGPIMSLALFANRLNGSIIKILRKGGIFLGEADRALHQEYDERDSEDLYEATAKVFARLQTEFKATIEGNAELEPRLLALQRFMSALDANVILSKDGAEIQVKRGITKNPLTISIYGSGIDGIATKFANGLLENLYAMLSEADAQKVSLDSMTYEGFEADYELLTGAKVAEGKSGLYVAQSKASNTSSNQMLSPAQFEGLQSHVRHLFVNQLSAAIQDQILNHVGASTTALQRATNIQSIFLTAAYRIEMYKALEAKKADPNYRKGDFLSQREMDQILERLNKYAPSISTGTQNFFIAGAERTNIAPSVKLKDASGNEVSITIPENFGRDLDGTFRANATMFGPSVAGVKGVPSLVIGTGDGMIMQNEAIRSDRTEGTLKVFDGINLPADRMIEGSRKVNESVWKAMSANPMKAVADTFNTFLMNEPVAEFLENNQVDVVTDFLRKELSKDILGKAHVDPKEYVSNEEIQAELLNLQSRLQELALETEARNLALQEVTASFDQMASAAAPFVKEGTLEVSSDPDVMAEIINRRQDEILQELKDKAAGIEPIEKTTEVVSDSFDAVTTPLENGARLATIPSLKVWADNTSELSKDQKTLAISMLNSLADSGYQIVMGTPSQVREYEAVNYPDHFTEVDFLGKVVPETRHIYLTNISPETLLHELVHAATLDKVVGYFNNPKALSEQDRAAIEKLDGLMDEWRVQGMDADDAPTNIARQAAAGQINNYVRSGQRAFALNEFMAWVLTNQHLAAAAKKTSVKNPALRWLGEALTAIKTLVFGKRAPQVADDLLSNVRFNTRILLKTATPAQLLTQNMRKVALFQSPSYGSDSRLTNLRMKFSEVLNAYIVRDTSESLLPQVRQARADKAIQEAGKRLSGYVAGVFNLTPQAQATFSMIHAALSTATDLNPAALSKVQDIYNKVLEEVKVESFMVDPASTNPADRYIAQQKYDVLTGAYDNSNLLPLFTALAMVDNSVRGVLAGTKLPKSKMGNSGTFDDMVDNFGLSALDRLGETLTGTSKSANSKVALDRLVETLSELTENDMTLVEQYSNTGLDKADAIIKQNLDALSEKAAAVSKKVAANASSNLVRNVARVVGFGASLANSALAPEAINGTISLLNKAEGWTTAREVFAEIVGRREDTKNIFDLISVVRAMVQQVRQQFREKVPEQLLSQFQKPLTEADKRNLFRGLAKTDVAVLHGYLGLQGAKEVLTSPARLASQIKIQEDAVKALAPNHAPAILRKAKQLADHMNGKSYGVNLLRNAYAVARLYGEPVTNMTASEDLVKAVDALASLYAYDGLDQAVKDNLTALFRTEPKGMDFLFSYLIGTRKDEMGRSSDPMTRINGYKGYAPAPNKQGASLVVASANEAEDLVLRGYKPIRDYVGSSAERKFESKKYFYNPDAVRAVYNQGVLQTVHETHQGVRTSSGYTLENIAGRITNPKTIAQIQKALAGQKNTTEDLLPIYNEKGTVVAYERAMDMGVLGLLNREEDLFNSLGVWQGRIAEESLAQIYNEKLIDAAFELWKKDGKDKRLDEYVDISESTDPVHKDAWNLIPDNVRKMIFDKFGGAGFPVRKDQINDVVGYRSASVGDVFTKNTRWGSETADKAMNVALAVFGENAYNKLVKFERTLQSLVTEAKVTIVVKSVIVPVANLVSNVVQLTGRGVPLRYIAKGFGTKTEELNTYSRRRAQEIELDAQMKAAEGSGNLAEMRKLETRLKTIRESYKRMSIWPLIEAGEFSAITEGGISNDDITLSNWVDKATGYLPEILKTPYRNIVLTKDTALFKGMAKTVQYGDFLAKAVMYDDLVKRKGMTKAEALAAINEEFVNYNRMAGRTRTYAEGIGLLWFWNFKLRSIKVAASMLRNNPARALLGSLLPGSLPVIGSIGSPIADNMLSVAIDGRMDNSMGPGMGIRAPTLNPWYALFF